MHWMESLEADILWTVFSFESICCGHFWLQRTRRKIALKDLHFISLDWEIEARQIRQIRSFIPVGTILSIHTAPNLVTSFQKKPPSQNHT